MVVVPPESADRPPHWEASNVLGASDVNPAPHIGAVDLVDSANRGRKQGACGHVDNARGVDHMPTVEAAEASHIHWIKDKGRKRIQS